MATAEVERVAMASEMTTPLSRSASWTNETAVAVMRERRVSAAVHLVIAVLAVATTAKAAVSKATVSLGEDSNNDGCSGKDGGRFGGGGNKVDPSSRIGSGGDVGGDGKSNSNSDSQAADSDGVQKFKNGGCCEACDGSGSNGGSGAASVAAAEIARKMRVGDAAKPVSAAVAMEEAAVAAAGAAEKTV